MKIPSKIKRSKKEPTTYWIGRYRQKHHPRKENKSLQTKQSASPPLGIGASPDLDPLRDAPDGQGGIDA